MTHLTFVAICPALSENLRARPVQGLSSSGMFVQVRGRAREACGWARRFRDKAEAKKTNTNARMAVRKNKKRDRFPNVGGHLEVVSSARGFLVIVGPVTLLLDREAAEELTCRLVDALEPEICRSSPEPVRTGLLS
jgi:hypothetical protein